MEGRRPRRVRMACWSSGVAATMRLVAADASGNSARGASSADMNVPDCPAAAEGASTSAPPTACRNLRRFTSEPERGPEEQRALRGLRALGGDEVGDAGQALAVVRPRALQGELEDDEGDGTVGKAQRYAVDEAVLALDGLDDTARERGLGHHATQPDLLATRDEDERGIFEVLGEEGRAQEVRHEAVAEIHPVAVLGVGQPGELELDRRVHGRQASLQRLLEYLVRQPPDHAIDALEARIDVLPLD